MNSKRNKPRNVAKFGSVLTYFMDKVDSDFIRLGKLIW